MIGIGPRGRRRAADGRARHGEPLGVEGELGEPVDQRRQRELRRASDRAPLQVEGEIEVDVDQVVGAVLPGLRPRVEEGAEAVPGADAGDWEKVGVATRRRGAPPPAAHAEWWGGP